MIQEGVRADGDDDEPRIAFLSKGNIVDLVEKDKLNYKIVIQICIKLRKSLLCRLL